MFQADSRISQSDFCLFAITLLFTGLLPKDFLNVCFIVYDTVKFCQDKNERLSERISAWDFINKHWFYVRLFLNNKFSLKQLINIDMSINRIVWK